jgi:hypothetical protein
MLDDKTSPIVSRFGVKYLTHAIAPGNVCSLPVFYMLYKGDRVCAVTYVCVRSHSGFKALVPQPELGQRRAPCEKASR